MNKFFVVLFLIIYFCIPASVKGNDGRECHLSPKGEAECSCIDKNKVFYGQINNKDIFECLDKETYEKIYKETADSLVSPPDKDPLLQKEKISIPSVGFGGDGEVSLDNNYGKFLDDIRGDAVKEEFKKNLQSWEKKLKEAEQKGQFKDGADKDEFLRKSADEKATREQLKALSIEAGFNHQRILESTGTAKYDHMSAEYKKRFPTPAENMFDASSNAIEFEKARSNIEGMMKQSEDLKKILKEKYYPGWKAESLSVPPKPTEEKQKRETGSIWDILLKNKLNK